MKVWEPSEITGLYGNKIRAMEIGTLKDDFVNNLMTFRISVNGKSVFGKVKSKYVNSFLVLK